MPTKSISQIAIRAMSLRLFVVVLLTSVLSYNHNYQTIRSKTISELQKYAKERVDRESIRFDLASKNLDVLDKTFAEHLERPLPNLDKLFTEKFIKRRDGSFIHRHADDPQKNQTFIRPNTTLTPELKKTILIADNLLTSFGNAWSSTYQNVWIVGKEDYGAVLWANRPHAMSKLPVDFSFLTEEFASIGLPANNRFGKPTWTGPYYDLISDDWLVSINHPFYYKGEYLLSFGMDMSLTDLNKRTVSNALEGTYNFIFQGDGRLVIHPDMMNDIINRNGKYYLQNSHDPVLRHIYHDVIKRPGEVIFDKENHLFLASGQIKGPNWFFVIVYPEANLKSLAMETAQFVAIIGIISLLIELLMLFQVLQKYVTSPISKLIQASNGIATGKHSKVEIDSHDEIGHLARSFNTMGEKVMERDKKLSAQAEELESLVAERTKELDLQRAKAFQSAKMATLGEMSGGIAHEINNPLSIIGLSAESIRKQLKQETRNDEKILNNVERIEKTVQRISKIVKGMRSFSRNAENDPKASIPLTQIIENTLTLCEETLKKKEVKLICDEIPNVSVECREVEIVQSLLNLVQNSIDAMEYSLVKEIKIRAEVRQQTAKFIVEDTGPGINDELASKIMNPFFTTKEIGKGTGLGLFISLGLVESNGGRLYLDNKVQPTRFVIELPISKTPAV